MSVKEIYFLLRSDFSILSQRTLDVLGRRKKTDNALKCENCLFRQCQARTHDVFHMYYVCKENYFIIRYDFLSGVELSLVRVEAEPTLGFHTKILLT